MLTAVKNAVRRLLSGFGLEIRKIQPAGVARASLEGALRQLSNQGFTPRTVIDVGVAFATTELYQAFPKSDILLIEPLVEFEPFLQRICCKYKAQYVLAAAGSAAGFATLNLHEDRGGSSLLKEVEGPSVDGPPRQVPVITIDDKCAEKSLIGPYLIKVDVQGAELEVLAGAQHTLLETEVVILEVALLGMIVGAPQLCDVVLQMREYGFAVYDFYGFLYRPFDGALAQIDIVFVRDEGHFRESHVYATPEQRKQLARAAKSARWTAKD